jgi:hypothetical protein
MANIPRKAWRILDFAIGGLFIYAGAVKAFDPIGFANDIDNYKLLPWTISVRLAFFLPWLEMFCGLALITRRLYLGGLLILTALMSVFIGASIVDKARASISLAAALVMPARTSVSPGTSCSTSPFRRLDSSLFSSRARDRRIVGRRFDCRI